MELSEETLTKIDEVITRYPEKRSASLMVIHLVQDELGCISNESCEWIADKLELQPINISELVTFYPMLRESPWGKTHVRVCQTSDFVSYEKGLVEKPATKAKKTSSKPKK